VPRPIPLPVPEEPKLTQRDRIPWLGVKVLVSKKGHPRKGQPAIVCDVRPGQPTTNITVSGVPLKQSSPSGLKIQVQFLNYDPNVPFPKENLEYDDLVEFEYVFLKKKNNVRILTGMI
jgi:hypothetical protein